MSNRERWLDEGLVLLTEQGPAGVTIDALCARLGLTKGSFYHHFRGRSGFQAALLEHFERRETQRFIDVAEADPAVDGAGRIRRLVEAVVADAGGQPELEVAVRVWAKQSDLARGYLERIDRTRVAYAQRLWREALGDDDRADDLGQMMYLLLIGAHHVIPPASPADLARLSGRLLELLKAPDHTVWYVTGS